VTLLISRAKLSSFKRICHPDRSEAQWRDLLFLFRFSHRIVILRVCGRTNGTETFVREPGRTADPSAALGMTKGEGGDFY
jgi:hypothetical protein